MDEERLEKVRKLRELRKYGKKVQAEVQLRRQKEKKDMLDQVKKTLKAYINYPLETTIPFPSQVKKFRKGQTDTIDFLEEGGGKGKKSNKQEPNQA